MSIINTLLPQETTREELEEWIRSSWPSGVTASMKGYIIGESKKAFKRVDGRLVAQVVDSFIQK